MADCSNTQRVGIVGSGLIGRSWAMIFASAGFHVKLFDSVATQVDSALEDIRAQMERLQQDGLLRGTLTIDQQMQLISGARDLAECVRDAVHVQECTPERLEMKQLIFEQLDKVAAADTVLCSSISCIVPSKFTESLQHRSRCLVAHPVNPPFYLPLVELVPAPWTDSHVVMRTRQLMQKVGQVPVTLTREMPGFCLNRVQYAILNQCWQMVSDGVISAADMETVMTHGLGPRYAFLGALETAHLNAEGMADYCKRYGEGIFSVSNTFGPTPRWEGASAEEIHRQMTAMTPLDKLQERRVWRDKHLAALAKMKLDLAKED